MTERTPSVDQLSLDHLLAAEHPLICAVPTWKYPSGRTGTSAGRSAHSRIGEPSCSVCLEGHAASMRAKREADPLRFKHVQLKARFKLTIDDYRRMLAEQNGGCAICGSAAPKHRGSAWSGFHVDHDNSCCPGSSKTCGKCVRGLLCGPCNAGMGSLGDDPERLIAAANYLLAARKRRSDGTTPTQAGDPASANAA